jgi:hypothetical protein
MNEDEAFSVTVGLAAGGGGGGGTAGGGAAAFFAQAANRIRVNRLHNSTTLRQNRLCM